MFKKHLFFYKNGFSQKVLGSVNVKAKGLITGTNLITINNVTE